MDSRAHTKLAETEAKRRNKLHNKHTSNGCDSNRQQPDGPTDHSNLKVDFICCALYCLFTNLDRPTPNPTSTDTNVFSVPKHLSAGCAQIIRMYCLFVTLIFLCSLFFMFSSQPPNYRCRAKNSQTIFNSLGGCGNMCFCSVICWSYLVHTIYGKTFERGKDKNRFRHGLHGNTCWRMLRAARKMDSANPLEPVRSNKNEFTWCPDR